MGSAQFAKREAEGGAAAHPRVDDRGGGEPVTEHEKRLCARDLFSRYVSVTFRRSVRARPR